MRHLACSKSFLFTATGLAAVLFGLAGRLEAAGPGHHGPCPGMSGGHHPGGNGHYPHGHISGHIPPPAPGIILRIGSYEPAVVLPPARAIVRYTSTFDLGDANRIAVQIGGWPQRRPWRVAGDGSMIYVWDVMYRP